MSFLSTFHVMHVLTEANRNCVTIQKTFDNIPIQKCVRWNKKTHENSLSFFVYLHRGDGHLDRAPLSTPVVKYVNLLWRDPNPALNLWTYWLQFCGTSTSNATLYAPAETWPPGQTHQAINFPRTSHQVLFGSPGRETRSPSISESLLSTSIFHYNQYQSRIH